VTSTASGPIQNPVLRGFYPDPSICRVGDDYYIANSTFEWFPGVSLSHSRDLVHWEQVGYALTRSSQLDMRGDPNSGGIWAPCLTHADGLFWLIYTDVRGWTGPFKDVQNFLVTSPSIDGPWSEPIYLNGVGFDASLFHDDDGDAAGAGRKWYVQMAWDHRPGKNQFHGIVVQEYDVKARKLVGPRTRIFGGTTLGKVEGPHLLKRNGWYYLTSAEGGTFVDHAETVARSRSVTGPYEEMPGNPLLSAAGDPGNPLHSSGHGCLVETPAGEWYMAHLCRRPIVNGRSMLGRETAIQKIVWDADGWPRLAQGVLPAVEVPDPGLGSQPFPETPTRDEFDEPRLAAQWQNLRLPLDEAHYSLTERPGHLRLKGRESIISTHDQTLVARRQRAFHIQASTVVEFAPDSFQQMAGLVAFYNTENFYYLFVTTTDHARLAIGLMSGDRGKVGHPIEKVVDVSSLDRVYLRLEIDMARLRFSHSSDGVDWVAVGDELDASVLSDEYGVPWAFTGNFVGMACQDLTGSGQSADFDWFEYREL
jgi:xylan 1,4-beta-xylosidase